MTAVTIQEQEIAVGLELPELRFTPQRVELFLFSAATYNAHRIHYDRAWAMDVEGLPDVLVHGPFQGALLSRLVTDWIGTAGRVTSFRVRHLKSTYPEQELVFKGSVTEATTEGTDTLVTVELREENAGGDLLTTGLATVIFPGAAS